MSSNASRLAVLCLTVIALTVLGFYVVTARSSAPASQAAAERQQQPQPQAQPNDVFGPWVWRYTPMREPTFVPSGEAAFLKPGSRVMGVSLNGVSKAYQDFVVHEHHFVQDTIAGVPLLVTWCGLCNTAMVYRNEVDGRPLTPDLAGLRGLNWIMRDRETGSLWQQATGEAFAGPLKGRRLPPMNFVLTSWAEWHTQHPDSLVLVPDPTHAEGYRQMEQQHARGGLRRFAPPASWGDKLRADSRLPDREEVLGVELGEARKAYPIAAVRERSVVNDHIGGTPVLLTHTAESDMITGFVRANRGRTLTFERQTAGAPNLVDRETSSVWTPYGESISGPLKGTQLEPITPTPSFWFGWVQFYPDTELFGGDASTR